MTALRGGRPGEKLAETISSVSAAPGFWCSAMKKLRADRTSFVIAHRLSTIRDADVILVMRNGAIVEQGTHDELLAAHGHHYRL